MFDYQVWAYLEGTEIGSESWVYVCFSSVGISRGDWIWSRKWGGGFDY